MISSEQRIKLLRRCQHPRSLIELTTGEAHSMLAKHVESWLAELCADGLLVKSAGYYVTTEDGHAELEALSRAPSVAGSRLPIPKENYVPKPWGRVTAHIASKGWA